MASVQQAIEPMEQAWKASVKPVFATKIRRARIRPIATICRLASM